MDDTPYQTESRVDNNPIPGLSVTVGSCVGKAGDSSIAINGVVRSSPMVGSTVIGGGAEVSFSPVAHKAACKATSKEIITLQEPSSPPATDASLPHYSQFPGPSPLPSLNDASVARSPSALNAPVSGLATPARNMSMQPTPSLRKVFDRKVFVTKDRGRTTILNSRIIRPKNHSPQELLALRITCQKKKKPETTTNF